MANVRCPNCNTTFSQPTNVLAWILGIFAVLAFGGFLMIITCLAAITAIGSNAEQFEQSQSGDPTAEVSLEFDAESHTNLEQDWE